MNDSHVGSLEQIKEFLKIDSAFKFEGGSKKEKYQWIADVLIKFGYRRLKKRQKKDKIIIRKYIHKVTGLSVSQITRLIKKYKKIGVLKPNYSGSKGNGFQRFYTASDIELLINTDIAHRCLNGRATKEILKREYETFKNTGYERISNISVAHIYNIRSNNRQYGSSQAVIYKPTPTIRSNIGVRRKPSPNGQPGYLRVDSVHQGDLNKEKGLYHINLVDETTQWEMVATVEKISEKYLKSVVEEMLALFPFVIYEFHSDNGSEYINRIIAELLNKLHIELTKKRSRHTNDNALVESKNGSIIRKLYGRNHIPQEYAPIINEFNRKYVNIYLNYHRPCGFATDKPDKKGKIKKVYDVYMTPYEVLKSHLNASEFLKEGISFEILDKIAYAKSDNQFAEEMREAQKKLFEKISNDKKQSRT